MKSLAHVLSVCLLFITALAKVPVDREICLVDEGELCLSPNEQEVNLVASVGRAQASLWTLDIEETSNICVTGEINCFFVNNNALELNLVESTNFDIITTQVVFEVPIFQISVGGLCLTHNLATLVECVDASVANDLADFEANEVEQFFFLLAAEDEFPEIEEDNNNNDNNNNDNNRGRNNDSFVFFLVFQIMLFVGLFAVAMVFVYKYNLVPQGIKDLWYNMTNFQKDISKTELAEITAENPKFNKSEKEVKDTEDADSQV